MSTVSITAAAPPLERTKGARRLGGNGALRLALANTLGSCRAHSLGHPSSRLILCGLWLSMHSVRLTDLTLSCERFHARSGRAARQLPRRHSRGAKRTATDVTPQWNGSAEAARPPGRRQAARQLQREVSRPIRNATRGAYAPWAKSMRTTRSDRTIQLLSHPKGCKKPMRQAC